MRVAILGGGVAGVSAAIALRLNGFDVSVYERHKAETNIGAGIVVWPNAAFVLEKLGVLNRIISASGYPTEMRRFSQTGESLGSVNIKSINNMMGYPSLSILRTDFQGILISRLNELGIHINYDHQVTELHVNDAKANVNFHNGKTIYADIVIGADGRMASIARKYVLGENKPVYQGFINWIGVFESKEDLFEEIVVNDYWGVGERFGIVPVSKYRAYWAGGIASTEIKKKNPDLYKNELESIFSSWPGLISKMIAQTPVSQINKIYIHDHDPINVWHKNNVIVIGDAVHAALPTSGQGACQALEDAWHLANCLTENNTDITQALTQFTELRLDKTSGITATGRGLASSIFNTDKAYCKARDENSKATDFSSVAAGMARAWSQNLITV